MIRRAPIALALVWLVAHDATAQRVQLDDSLSPIDTFAVTFSWEPATTRRALAALLAGAANAAPPLFARIDNVEVRLDTRAYVGRRARIYVTLPTATAGLASPNDLELRWDVTTPFIPGAARPGQSTLVFEGMIDASVTSASFTFALRLDRSPDADTFAVEPYYELEILP